MMNTDPTEIPVGFRVRAPKFLPVILWMAALMNVATLLAQFSAVSILLAAGLAFAGYAQFAWHADIRPDGISFRNKAGVDWDRTWDELRPGVVVQRPARFGSLVRGRLRTGRRVAIPNGPVRTLAGGPVAPETARGLIQAWADAGTGSDIETS